MTMHAVLASRPSLCLIEKTIGDPAYTKLTRDLAHPIQSQQRILGDLLRRGRGTLFGKLHGFSDIDGSDEFARAVPVSRYEGLQPYVERMYRGGEPNVLWPGLSPWFVESSGTTGPKKLLPVTMDGWKRQYLETAKTYVIALDRRLRPRSLLRGKSIFFPGKIRHAHHDPRILVGDITALSVRLTPWYLDFVRAPSKAITIDPNRNWEERLHRIARATVSQDIVHLAGLPTWLVHFGRIVLEMTGESSLRRVWPNLIATTLGGVNAAPYLPALEAVLGTEHADQPILHSEVYNGTEGFYAMQVDDGDMVLLPDGGLYYEFIERKAAVLGDYSDAIPLHEVKLGRDYAPVVSTYCGLWRYLIGDTVCFTSTAPYRLQVSGRVSQYLNVAGEELLVANVDAAMEKVCSDFGVTLSNYIGTALQRFGPEDAPRHLWLVALAEDGAVDERAFATAFDQTLIQQHFDYEKMRNQGMSTGRSFGLGSPIVLLISPNSFTRWLHKQLEGGIGGQTKVPRLCQDGHTAASMLRLLEPETLEQILTPYPGLSPAGLLATLDNTSAPASSQGGKD